MDYSVVPIDIRDVALCQKVCNLLSDTFGSEVTRDHLETCTTTDSETASMYVAAMQNDEIIGFNAFISHDLRSYESKVNAFQSCWTATSRHHRGKRIFQNLINEAKVLLKERGAAFIFGFPNENSHAIFTKKLGFREVPSLKWQVPNLPFLRTSFVAMPEHGFRQDQERVEQNDRQLIAMKSRRHGALLDTIETRDGVVWGVKRERTKAGIRLKYCEIGGVTLANDGNPKRLLGDFFKTAKWAVYFQATTTEGNTLNPIFRKLTPARTNDLIVFDLNIDTSANMHFDFFGGVKDVF